VPAAALIELAEVCQQAMHRCIEVRRHLRDSLAEQFEFSIHGESISFDSDILVAAVLGGESARCSMSDSDAGNAGQPSPVIPMAVLGPHLSSIRGSHRSLTGMQEARWLAGHHATLSGPAQIA
jgi:hypothetical protein